ncbi:MAG: ion channel [Brevundimonas sp.]|uniref:ion channel n=1 Tax=Brevundimonas sp. TaxID=1871086 RepID=UPI0028D2D946|nr:ion channel [uncultured Brevundimonas sp.]
MGLELAIATIMVLLTVGIHGVGLLGVARVLGALDKRRGQYRINPVSWEGATLAGVVAMALLTLHGLEIWLYAFVFMMLDAISSLRDAVYFSTISYATIGYTDAPILEEWRLLGAIEGVNGTLLMGWSVAFFVTVMTRILPRARR